VNLEEAIVVAIDFEKKVLALVQAQLDAVQGVGFWFDVAEFRLEAE
jgi:hypothetical protein